MILLIQTLGKGVAKKKFGLCLIAKLRGQLLHFSFIQKFHHVRFLFFGPGDRIFVCLHDCAIPHYRRFLPHNLPPKTLTIVFFFPAPCQKACV